eukprot:270176-Rhodomonas_salina.1
MPSCGVIGIASMWAPSGGKRMLGTSPTNSEIAVHSSYWRRTFRADQHHPLRMNAHSSIRHPHPAWVGSPVPSYVTDRCVEGDVMIHTLSLLLSLAIIMMPVTQADARNHT